MDHSGSTLNLARSALIGTLALVLSACGGGGGDDDGSVPPPGDIDVTASNQDTLSRAAAVAVQGGFVDDSIAIAGGAQSGALRSGRQVALAAPRSRVEAPMLAIVRAALLRGMAALAVAGGGRKRAAAVIGPVNDPCFVSGSRSETLDDRDGSGTPTTGDTITVVFNACRETDSEVVNGTLTSSFTEVVPSPLKLSANATLTNFSMASTLTVRSATYNGGFVLAYSEPSATTSTSRIDVTSPLTVRVIHPLYDDTLTLQAGFSARSMYDTATPPGAASGGRALGEAAGRVASLAAGGTVSVWTQPPNIDQWDVERYPRSGRVLVQGNRGNLLLTILSAASVRLELDIDGDAVMESTKDVPWESLI